MTEELWASFSSQLLKMEEESKVDLSVVPTIQNLIKNCKENEEFWVHNTSQARESNFASFHALRNIRLILKKVEGNLITAEARHSNPIDVENALSMLPSLSSLHMFVNSIKDKPINARLRKNLYLDSRQLRDKAIRYSFLPSLEDEIRGINKRTLRSRITRLSKTTQNNLET